MKNNYLSGMLWKNTMTSYDIPESLFVSNFSTVEIKELLLLANLPIIIFRLSTCFNNADDVISVFNVSMEWQKYCNLFLREEHILVFINS